MDTRERILDLLEQLKVQTGITFSIDENALTEEETIETLKNMLHAQHSGTSKESFWRNLLLGLLSPEEILRGTHRFHIEKNEILFPVLLESRRSFSSMQQSVIGQFFSSGADVIVPIDDSHTAVLHRTKQLLSHDVMKSFVCDMQAALESEAMTPINVAYDEMCTSIEQLPAVFLNISTAMEIGSIFDSTRHVFWAHDLGMGKLIYHLPAEVCEEYIKDHFRGIHTDAFDEETLHTIHAFLESGLSIAECARKLYLHRNTLIYRLDKIEKLTGLDIRTFDDAMTCKVAMMMSDYLVRKR